MLEGEGQSAAREEFWQQIVSQLRSRLASMVTGGEVEDAKLDEPLPNEFYVSIKDGYLSVWLNSDNGKGSWNALNKELDRAEPWSMSPEGIVELSGEKMDLSHAVESFARKLKSN